MGFEKLQIWKRSKNLAVDIYRCLNDSKEFGLKDQLTRSALSVPSNIAEGYERDSNAEFCRFLKIAKGSAGEVRTQLIIAQELGIIDPKKSRSMITEITEISCMIKALIIKKST